MFQKILVALDGSEHSWKALESAIHIAKRCDGKITLIHVYSPVTPRPMVIPEPSTLAPPAIPPATVTEVSKAIEASKRAGTEILEKGQQQVKAERIQVDILLMEGRAAEEIVKTAKEGNFDLVAMGARGLSKLKEILLGGVSHDVIRKASCPVLIVK